MSAQPDTILHQGVRLSVKLCSEGHVHLCLEGKPLSFELPLSSQEAAELAAALQTAASDAKAVEQGGSAACH